MEQEGVDPRAAFQAPPTLIPTPAGGVPSFSIGQENGSKSIADHLKVQLLVRAYQVRGHHKAKIDPLGIKDMADLDASYPKELKLEHYGWTEKDLDRKISLGPGILPRFADGDRKQMTLREIIAACEKTYCGSYGVEYVHIPDRYRCDWIRERVEIPQPYAYPIDEKRRILDRLIWSDSFERFLATKYPNDKRFGLEGCESLIPGMKAMIDRSVDLGVRSIVIGMPHRGRLNVLSNVIRKPNESIFGEFAGTSESNAYEGSGDVKYHLGMNFERPTPSGKRVSLSLVANPSHLEAEDPVVLGKTRAIQHYSSDEETHEASMGLLIHGDAAFAAQGVVYETMGMYALPHYSTGGTIHLVVNNQIGFTTDPRFARSTPYATDIAKAIDAPIFHVNGDDVEAVTFICQLASEWRQTFKTDCIVDIICYRKHGHNESDQPSFTQPRMYEVIAKKEPALQVYCDQLIKEGSLTKEDVEEHKKWIWGQLEDTFSRSRNYQKSEREWLTSSWHGFASPKDLATKILPHLPTAVEESVLKEVGRALGAYPDDFNVHRNLKRIIKSRTDSIEKGVAIDMSTAEALAFGTLCKEGNHVRVAGQDVERGTFSQRHAVLHDQKNESTYTSLQHVDANQGKFVICNSSLSEFGVLGFEYGYSLSSPDALIMWEAQFGDFANNAQCIIDQFIASGESKWLQRSGIVLSLPHGYDGQGPEHSSARMERFLQLCSEEPTVYPSPDKLDRQHQDCNMQLVYCTTPANLFHVLRRQVHREFRKPLVLFFSKSLLRHPLARSNLNDFMGESFFMRVIDEQGHGDILKDPSECERAIICSGQVWAALYKARETNKIDNIPIIRLEQFHPFPWEPLNEALSKYKNLKSLVYCQEEPMNAGAWTFVQPRLRTLMKHMDISNIELEYCGRPMSASVATGNKGQHKAEEEGFLKAVCLSL